MLTENQDNSAANQFLDLFGEPPLIREEDKDRYRRLHTAVVHQVKPKTIFDQIRVRELTDKLWQQQRCKQSAASLVDSAFTEALATLLRPFIVPSAVPIEEDSATKMARDYYSGYAKPKRLEEIEDRLAVNCITPEQIRAKAMQLCGNAIATFNGMEAHCEKSLRTLRRDNARRSADEDHAGGADEPDEV